MSMPVRSPSIGCPDDGTLRAYVAESLARAELDRIGAHLVVCRTYRQLVMLYAHHATALVKSDRSEDR